MPAPSAAETSLTVLGARVHIIDRGPRLSPADLLRLVSKLPATERHRIEGLHRWQDRQDSAMGWDLLHRLARERGVALYRAENCRPGCDPPRDVSLSHSAGWIAAAISEAGRIGLDVQTIHDVGPSLARRCLSNSELEWLQGATDAAARDHRFCRLWTAKEAYLKAIGIGLTVDPREVSVDLSGDEPRLMGSASWQLSELAPGAGACVTVCMERAP